GIGEYVAVVGRSAVVEQPQAAAFRHCPTGCIENPQSAFWRKLCKPVSEIAWCIGIAANRPPASQPVEHHCRVRAVKGSAGAGHEVALLVLVEEGSALAGLKRR